MDAILAVGLLMVGIYVMAFFAVALATKRNEAAQESIDRAMVRARLHAIAKQRNDWYHRHRSAV